MPDPNKPLAQQFISSTAAVPQTGTIPRHIAIIMDGNGRWGKGQRLQRFSGHHQGVETVRATVRSCLEKGVEYLTLFAFSSENWRRPEEEVSLLMKLFLKALQSEVSKLKKNGVRLRTIGDLSRFDKQIQHLVSLAEEQTSDNDKLNLTIAVNYGGRWDILQAVNKVLASRCAAEVGPSDCKESELEQYLAMQFAPEPDLFIRTGGEQRVSNFLLWQLAYTELYFTDVLWPDFDAQQLELAIASYQRRERRFGRTSAQVQVNTQASVVSVEQGRCNSDAKADGTANSHAARIAHAT